jgi:uncharacterized protein YndB with AHSA1/START domain
MRAIVNSVEIEAPIDRVWEALAAVDRHAEWMTDAESIEFLSERRSGSGTRIRVRTRVGPLRVDDDMEFSVWEPPHRMAVRHVGRIRGGGHFHLAPTATGTQLTWGETLVFPWYLGGVVGRLLAGPVLRRVFAANLERFAATIA